MNTQNCLRLDTNIASQIDIFRQYGSDGALMKSLLFLLAVKEQSSLIKNVGSIDVNEVSKKLGISRARLMIEHAQPAQFIRLREQFRTQKALDERLAKDNSEEVEFKLFDSVLENALYRLNTESLRFEGGYRYYEENGNKMVVQEAETIQFLEGLKIRKITTPAGQSKYVYDYKLSAKFMTNFAVYFNYIDIESVNALRPKNLDDLYIFLSNLRNTLQSKNVNSTNWYSFERLCELANINFQINTNATTLAEQTQHIRNAKRKLNQQFEQIEAIANMGVTLGWEKTGGETHPYTPVITFDFSRPTIIDPHKARARMMCSEFCRLLLDEIKVIYPNMNITEDNAEIKVLKYIQWKDKNDDLLRQVFKNAHKLIFKTNEIVGFESVVKNLPYNLTFCKCMDQLCDTLSLWSNRMQSSTK